MFNFDTFKVYIFWQRIYYSKNKLFLTIMFVKIGIEKLEEMAILINPFSVLEIVHPWEI